MTREHTVMFSNLNGKDIQKLMVNYFIAEELVKSEARANTSADRGRNELSNVRSEIGMLERELYRLRTRLDNLHYINV